MFHIFKRKAYHWWQIGLLKIAMLAIGIAIGANWPETLVPYTTQLVAGGVIVGIYLFGVWVKNK